MTPNTISFARKLFNLMEEKDISVKYISKEFGVSLLTVRRWIAKENEPHPAMQKVLLKELEKL